MNFTSQIFIFVLFPVCLFSYFISERLESRVPRRKHIDKFRIKDLLLISFSLLFYLWACFPDVFRLLLYITGVYGAGLWIQHMAGKRQYIRIFTDDKDGQAVCVRKVTLSFFSIVAAVLSVVFILIHFKYGGLVARCWNWLFRDSRTVSSAAAPLGISFLSFSAISYLVDIYREKARAGSFIDCLLYLSFFPKVISGPIVLWKEFETEITGRRTGLEDAVCGFNRIMVGFIKKLILADQFGLCVSRIPLYEVDIISAWGGTLLYMLQIYYDFSAYSDIAIGLSRLFGFHFRENFDFPYRSRSISEFWRRWHISLGTWFREYVYFPMGGSRKGQGRTLINLAVVFALTGLWHGSTKNYILWGMINGGMVLTERLIQNRRWYQGTPDAVKWFFTMGVTFFCWQFFRFASLSDVLHNIQIMFGMIRFDDIYCTWEYYFDRQTFLFTVVGMTGAVIPGSKKIREGYRCFTESCFGFAVQETVLLIFFGVAVLFMVNSSYHPFIYFRY